MKLKEALEIKKQLIDNELDRIIPNETSYPGILFKSMRYSVFAGGKRLRPVMALAACEIFDEDISKAMPFACALEMIHTYSLIHDDLPALDDDNFRRGRLTNHKAFGENIAILAGDGLLSYAFEVMANAAAKNPCAATSKALQAVAFAAGVNGMVAGQALDVVSEGKPLTKQQLDFINLNKTAAMIVGSVKAGAYAAGADEESVSILEKAAIKLGLAFQIQDDILDVVGTFEELGKAIHSDEKNEKTTYVTLFGLERSKEIVKTLSNEAIELFSTFGEKGEFFIELTKYLVDRKN